MAATRGNLLEAMALYLKDQNNVIATYIDAAQVRKYEYVNEAHPVQKGEALVSMANVQIPGRANKDNLDEIYPIYVSLGLYKRNHTEESGDMQTMLSTIREELAEDFQNNRDKLWGYFSPLDTGGEVLSTKFNRVKLGNTDGAISDGGQNCTFQFSVFVHLTRDVS